jgi:hypothetical protein
MKKEIVSRCLLFMIMLVLVLPVFSAVEVNTEDIVTGAETAGSAVAGFFQGLLDPFYGGASMATQVLLGILLFFIYYSVIPDFMGEDNTKLAFLITLIVTIVSVVAIPDGFFSAIMAQYGIMGATLLSVFPFIIILIFSVKAQNTLVARVVWLFYVLYYFGIYLYLTINLFIDEGKWVWVSTEAVNTLPYVIAMIAGFIMFFFIVKIIDVVFEGKMESLENKAENRIDLASLGLKLWGKAATGAADPK